MADGPEKEHAALAIRAARTRVILHLEPYVGRETKLFTVQPNPANVQQKLKQLVQELDPHPLVLSIATSARAGVPWSVTGI